MAQEGNTMDWDFDDLRAQVEGEMDLDAIREEVYRAVFMEDIADEVAREARKQAEAELNRRDILKRTSR